MLIEEASRFERESLEELARATDPAALEVWRARVLGGQGGIKALMGRLKEVPREEKPATGQHLNAVKARLEEAFDGRRAAVGSQSDRGPRIDITEPGLPPPDGRQHVLTRTIDEIVEVFGRMGFALAEGPEVEDEWHNFTALNIPEGHPARDPTDNFYMGEDRGAKRLLRTQTSTVQIRALERQKPPIRIIATGRVYRPDTHDATHYSMFHQIEGLYVDRGVTMVDLKSTLVHFAHAYFGPEAEVRMRPSFFPFTEPSAEVDMKMRVKGEWKWVELGGCGMVDPNVLRAVDIDPEEWTGFAFGLGIERIAMRRYGIADIRWLFENDARFLRQF
ncbi:MAG: phenylalanine--tRNA ligase subunit alpha [Phycisphaeraceae bacterium]|nr:phenylalanine--tRNA ligase subunit alpha [Phycisphaeraceae bacterium]